MDFLHQYTDIHHGFFLAGIAFILFVYVHFSRKRRDTEVREFLDNLHPGEEISQDEIPASFSCDTSKTLHAKKEVVERTYSYGGDFPNFRTKHGIVQEVNY